MNRFGRLQLFCMFVLAGLAAPLAGAEGLDGRVRDSRTHAGLSFVRVELIYLEVRVGLEYTDQDGRFFFGRLDPRNYTILATLQGYEPLSVQVNAATQNRVDLELAASAKSRQTASPVVSVRSFLIPKDAQKEFERAHKAIERQDCPSAIPHLESGLRLYDQSAPALNDLGNCRRKLGDLPGAEAAFKQALTLTDGPYVAMNLAETYTAQQRFAEAESVLMDAIRKTEDNGDIYYALAISYFKQDKFQEAEAAAAQAESRHHRIPDLHLLTAKIFAVTNPARVAPELERYLQEAPNGTQSKKVREVLKAAKKG
jgi:Flp pilus assembly protein TadD